MFHFARTFGCDPFINLCSCVVRLHQYPPFFEILPSIFLADANVPLRCKTNRKLGKWVSHQRSMCSRKDRVAKLDSIGFLWDATNLTDRKRQLDSNDPGVGENEPAINLETGPSPKKAKLQKAQQRKSQRNMRRR